MRVCPVVFLTYFLSSIAMCQGPAWAQAHTVTLTSADLDVSGQSDVAPAIQRVVSDGGVSVALPCGTFLVTSAIELPSNTQIEGQGACTVLKMDAQAKPARLQAGHMPGASGAQRSIFTNRTPGDTNIVVRALVVDGRDSPANGQLISFFRASHVLVEGVRFVGAGTPKTQDGVSFVASSDYTVRNNVCTNFTNACYDNWGGDKNFQITNNFVDGKGVLTYGILVNGITTDYRPGTSANFVIRDNKIHNVKELGIGAFGLCSKDRSVCGTIYQATIDSNLIDGVSKLHGIMVGNGSAINVSRNVIRGAAGNGVRVAAQNKGGETQNVVVEDNVIDAGSGKDAAISVGSGSDMADDIRVQRNRLTGYLRPLRITRGASVQSDAH